MERAPGYPDGLTNGKGGSFWLSLVTLESKLLQSWMNSRCVLGLSLPGSV